MSAVFSEDGRYRYRLDKFATDHGRNRGRVLFVALNPSKAGQVVDGKEITDPSATRMKGFAASWGYDMFTICNLAGMVATDPRELTRVSMAEAIGPENDEYVRAAATGAALIVACWGASYPRTFAGRARYMRLLLEQYGPVHHLGLTLKGNPRHPLYLPSTLVPTIWNGGLDV